MEFLQSKQAFSEALTHMPGGVNSPVRAFRSVGGEPIFIHKAEGCHLYDIDGNKFVDFVGSWGPAILGHNNPEVRRSVIRACENGLSFGAPTLHESELAKLIKQTVPSIEKVRLVNSGTEACMSAMRLARGFTKKPGFVKFSGCYHGHCDYFLVKAGSGALTFGSPNSGGIPENIVKDTYVLPYNESEPLEQLIDQNSEIGTIILEPIMGNCGFIKPKPEFLETLKQLQAKGICIIFDEVMTGFRVAFECAQSLFSIKPDITALGKIIGGGMPLAAYGARAEIMKCVAPDGDVYQAGTLSGNPIAVSAGIETLKQLQKKDYASLNQLGKLTTQGMTEIAESCHIGIQTDFCGGMFGFFFTEKPVYNYETSSHLSVERYKRFFQHMLKAGYYFAPSAYEASFLSFCHSEEIIHEFLKEFTHFCKQEK